jgi:polyvinyl alcohol dehydrogenase (cytochrome)
MRRSRILAMFAAVASGFVVLAVPASSGATSGADWPGFLRDAAHTSYNGATTSIAPGNIANLRPIWRWTVPPPPTTTTTNTALLATPVVSNGVVYIGSQDGYFFALSEAMRQVLWSDFLGIDTAKTCGGTNGIISTAAMANDPSTGKPTVYVNAPDGYLYALDAANGAIDWRGVVGIPSTTVNDYYAWGSPLVTGGKVYVGISSKCDNPLVRGGMVGFDQATGTQIGKWIDQPGSKLGGSIWSTPAVTSGGDRVIAGTGNGYAGSGQPLYDNSLVALDPNTLHLLDAWQVPAAQQITDGDFGASPTMFTVTINGVSTPMIGICNKNGNYYAFAQNDLAGGPVWQTPISAPYNGGSAQCAAAAIWDGSKLIEAGGNSTTINGTTYMGSVQALDPVTGTPLWQTGLPGMVLGSPTEDGAGVIAAVTLQSGTGTNGVYLLSAADGTILDFIPTPRSTLFGQAVFAQNDLLVGAGSGEGLTAYEITTPGPAITDVSPSLIGDSTTDTVHLTGSGFSGSPSVVVSGDGVFAKSVTVVSSTELAVKFSVKSSATQNPRDITVTGPGSPPVADTCSNCLIIGPKPASPTITSLKPSSFIQGATGVKATLLGTSFDSGAVATSHSGISLHSVYVSSTQLNLKVTVRSTVVPGSYNVWVTNADGLTAKCAGCLTVSAA